MYRDKFNSVTSFYFFFMYHLYRWNLVSKEGMIQLYQHTLFLVVSQGAGYKMLGIGLFENFLEER